MNRQQRRAAEKRGITAKDLRKEGLHATRMAVDGYSVAVAWTLYDKLGMENDKIVETMKLIEELFDSVSKDYLTLEDMKRTIFEETGLKL